ncbi:hypothetical protein QAD02_006478, partial [Eretmocerus hayati]
ALTTPIPDDLCDFFNELEEVGPSFQFPEVNAMSSCSWLYRIGSTIAGSQLRSNNPSSQAATSESIDREQLIQNWNEMKRVMRIFIRQNVYSANFIERLGLADPLLRPNLEQNNVCRPHGTSAQDAGVRLMQVLVILDDTQNLQRKLREFFTAFSAMIPETDQGTSRKSSLP